MACDASTFKVTAPDVPPPDKPVPAVTPVISPTSGAAIVIEPSAFVIVIPVPAVSVDTAGPDVPPISS